MEIANSMTQKRDEWIDFIKGIAAMMVILSHTPEVPVVYDVGFCFIMIPIFFFASGYICKYKGYIEFLYYRVLKLIILYILYGLITPFASITELRRYFSNPSDIVDTLISSLINIATGKTFWFVACLIVVSLLFCFMKILTGNNMKILMLISFCLFAFGLHIARKGMFYWSADTALVCQFFYVCGFVGKETKVFSREYNKKWTYGIYTLSYMAWILLWNSYLGAESIIINVAINQWKLLWITIPAIFLGCLSLISLGIIVDRFSFVNYIGRHTLVYFGFGSHGMSVANKFIRLLAQMHGLEFLQNNYISVVIICIIGSLIMVFPCMIIDRVLPVLNGKISLPKLKVLEVLGSMD